MSDKIKPWKNRLPRKHEGKKIVPLQAGNDPRLVPLRIGDEPVEPNDWSQRDQERW